MWEITWFILIGVFFAGYSVLDGFDLGIGLLWPLLSREGEERNLLFSTVEPFWDGNEVWLITGGAALFAAFPHAYATVFSGFYLVLMVLLFALIDPLPGLDDALHDPPAGRVSIELSVAKNSAVEYSGLYVNILLSFDGSSLNVGYVNILVREDHAFIFP